MGNQKIRHAIQAFWALVTNSYLVGFATGKIYTGPLKGLCVPGLNCYSCPGALGACPIGSLQATFASRDGGFPFYVCGFLFIVGAFLGRVVCGYLCPFGLIQGLLHKIPFPKKIKTFKGDKLLRKLKYVILAVFVVLLPMFLVDFSGLGEPYFCKLICPAGTLEAGIPLILMHESLRSIVGFMYYRKLAILAVLIILSIIIYRPFCKYICPLGAIYSVFNKVSLFRYSFDAHRCTSCGKCASVCEMNIDPTKGCNNLECIRCGKCLQACPTAALDSNAPKLHPNVTVSRGR